MYECFSGRRTAAWSHLWIFFILRNDCLSSPSTSRIRKNQNKRALSWWASTHTHTRKCCQSSCFVIFLVYEQYCTGMRYWFETCKWIISALRMIKESIGTQRTFLITAKRHFILPSSQETRTQQAVRSENPFQMCDHCPKESVTHSGSQIMWFMVR